MMDFAAARLNMVESQIRPNKVTNPALVTAMAEIPRELFVPKSLRGIAYIDEDIALGQGRFLMEPMVLARLLQSANIQPSDVVLDIGCATGYSAAVLARLCSTVVAVESDKSLAQQATRTLNELGIDNAVVVQAPLEQGYPSQAPYDVIVFEGAVEEIPTAIRQQLNDGGRLVAVVANPGVKGPGAVDRATLVTRNGSAFSSRTLFEAGTPLLPGFRKEPGFVF